MYEVMKDHELRSLLREAYTRLMREHHAGWCRVYPANRIGNNSYTTSKEEESFCDCGFSAWHIRVEKLLGLPIVDIWKPENTLI